MPCGIEVLELVLGHIKAGVCLSEIHKLPGASTLHYRACSKVLGLLRS